ncbi:hypothetical protein BJV82DRAFT_617417 [Fennellomyces sp. T-0311]|nr:hypothetical protein BJV82DRAFT_617417 [Fennellomyces sp. T-0311]
MQPVLFFSSWVGSFYTMGKSAKFYKRPSRKEKESKALAKQSDSGVAKKGKQQDTKMRDVSTAAAAAVHKEVASMDIDRPASKKQKQPKDSKPDYVDLFSGKKTYKRVPAKRK